MTKKPILVEVYAWNEPLLGAYALAWALFLALFDWESSIASGRYIISLFVGLGAVSLLLVQSEWMRTLIDFRAPAFWLRFMPPWLQRIAIKMWPASTLIRLANHFIFTIWWLLMGLAVSLRIDDLSDIRFIAYIAIGLFHFDRFLRLLQWMRQ